MKHFYLGLSWSWFFLSVSMFCFFEHLVFLFSFHLLCQSGFELPPCVTPVIAWPTLIFLTWCLLTCPEYKDLSSSLSLLLCFACANMHSPVRVSLDLIARGVLFGLWITFSDCFPDLSLTCVTPDNITDLH